MLLVGYPRTWFVQTGIKANIICPHPDGEVEEKSKQSANAVC